MAGGGDGGGVGVSVGEWIQVRVPHGGDIDVGGFGVSGEGDNE